MSSIETDCPICESPISISEKEIRLAISHKKDTDGKMLVTCPACCRALVLEGDKPEDLSVEEWIAEIAKDEDWCGCVPMLDPNQERIPAGGYADLNLWVYQPGGAGKALPRRQYMAAYGIDPQCYMEKNPDMGGKPVILGKAAEK